MLDRIKSTLKRNKIKKFIGLDKVDDKIDFNIIKTYKEEGYTRHLINYIVNGRKNIAYLLIPSVQSPHNAILINHQNNGERHYGKSEVCGLCGNKYQKFGADLAKAGFVVLAPDSPCFEDRRKNKTGIEPDDDNDFYQHFFEMEYGILTGNTLAKRVVEDAIGAISVLYNIDSVNKDSIGCMGHSYGGNTTIFAAAFDERIKYALASGSVASYKNRVESNVGIEMASLIPNIINKYEVSDIMRLIIPRKFMIVCAEDDKYSKDAEEIYNEINECGNFEINKYSGGHSLTEERYAFILDWVQEQI